MSDDLKKRLRDAVSGEHDMTPHGADCLQAADRIEELESERSKVMGHALALATTLHRNFYKTQAPNWEPLEDVVGVITQIDNMIIGVADRTEELEAKLAKAVGGLEDMQKGLRSYASRALMMVRISYILAELKGQGDD
jgi:hypothetical protein